MNYGLTIPLPVTLSKRVEDFRCEHTEWELRPMRSEPHISIKGPAGLDEGTSCLSMIQEIAADVTPFEVMLSGAALFDDEAILFLSVHSPGWHQLHRTLVDTILERTGATLHPLEVHGWLPHMTILRLKPSLLSQRDHILQEVDQVFPEYRFTATSLTMIRQDIPEGRWMPAHDFLFDG